MHYVMDDVMMCDVDQCCVQSGMGSFLCGNLVTESNHVISCNPITLCRHQVEVVELTDKAAFLILATDGVYQFLSSQVGGGGAGGRERGGVGGRTSTLSYVALPPLSLSYRCHSAGGPRPLPFPSLPRFLITS